MFIDPYQIQHAIRNGISIPTGAGSVAFSAGTLSSTRTDVTFSNSNGVSFGLDAAGVITASVGPAGGGLTNIKVSAGTLSDLRSDITFSNSGGVSFGLNGAGVITATVATNYQSQGAYLTTAQPPGAYLTTAMQSDASSAFAGTNGSIFGGSFTLNTSGATISLPAYLTTAALSQDSSKYAGTGFTTATTAGTNIVGTLNNGGLSMGVPAYLTAATAGGAGTGFTTATTAGTNVVGTLDTNGLSMGIPAYLTTAAAGSGAGTGFTTASTAGTDIVGTLNTNGLSMGVPAYLTTAQPPGAYLTTFSFPRLDQVLDPTADKVFSMGSNQLQLSWATGGSFSTNATRQGMFELDVAGNLTQEADVIHLHQHGGAPTLLDMLHIEADGANVTGIRAQMAASIAAEINQPIKFTTRDAGYNIGSVPLILGTDMSNSVANLNANYLQGRASSQFAGLGFTSASTTGTAVVATLSTNGLSMGIPAYLTTAATAAGGGVAISNSQTLFSTGTVNLLEGGGAITIASSAGGQSLKFSVPQTSVLAQAGGIVISSAGSTITISANLSLATQSYWANLHQFNNATTTMVQSNSFYVFPVTIPQNVEANYLRLLGSFNFTSTSIATSAVNNVTGASTAFSETVAWNAVFYSVGTGASSRSLQLVASSFAGLTWAVSVSQASTSNASRQSLTQAITFPNEGGNNASVTTQYSVSATNGPISTTQWSNLSAQRYLDIPFASTFSAGNYWLAINRFSGTVGGKNMDCNASIYGVSNTNLTFANLNSATNVSNAFPFMGVGLWTQAAAGTSASIPFANISVTTSYMIPFIQLIKQA